MSYQYHRYISRITRMPWAVLPSTAEIIAGLIAERANGHRPTAEEIAARLGQDMGEPARPSGDRIVVIPIHGVIAHRADAFELSSGGTSAELVGKWIRRAANDDSVRAIILDVDSPGGSTEGIIPAANEIFAARQRKPIVAVANSLMASAAYWLASQAHEIVVEPSGAVGSIGVFMLACDYTAHLEKEGIKIEIIRFGEHKIEGNPFEKMSDETREHFQTEVDDIGAEFHAHVARGREISVESVKSKYGDGRLFLADDAKTHGLVDRIDTLDATIARLAKSAKVMRRTAADSEDAPMPEATTAGAAASLATAIALEMEAL